MFVGRQESRRSGRCVRSARISNFAGFYEWRLARDATDDEHIYHDVFVGCSFEYIYGTKTARGTDSQPTHTVGRRGADSRRTTNRFSHSIVVVRETAVYTLREPALGLCILYYVCVCDCGEEILSGWGNPKWCGRLNCRKCVWGAKEKKRIDNLWLGKYLVCVCVWILLPSLVFIVSHTHTHKHSARYSCKRTLAHSAHHNIGAHQRHTLLCV